MLPQSHNPLRRHLRSRLPLQHQSLLLNQALNPQNYPTPAQPQPMSRPVRKLL